MNEREKIVRARAKRERRRLRDEARSLRESTYERRRQQAIAVRRLFGLDRHEAAWERISAHLDDVADWRVWLDARDDLMHEIAADRQDAYDAHWRALNDDP